MKTTVYKWEETLGGRVQRRELEVVRPEDDEPAEEVSRVNHSGANDEPNHVRQSPLQGQDEDVVGVEKSEIAKHADPKRQLSWFRKFVQQEQTNS